jgi:transposase
MVLEYRRDYPSQWAAISSIAMKCGMAAETLRTWVRKAEVDSVGRTGIPTEQRNIAVLS